ncbi:MAG: hypothetical protein R3B68_14065 [Phycisphaerales bacterium]
MRSWMRIGVGLVAAMFAAPALAQPTAQEVAEAAVQRVREITENTSAHLRTGAARAVERIEDLAANQAPDPVILRFGKRAIDALQSTADDGRGRIAETVQHAVMILRRLQADPQLVEFVLRAGHAGRERIGQAQQRAVGAVRHAVEEAIGPG